jgi:hypothetical protein
VPLKIIEMSAFKISGYKYFSVVKFIIPGSYMHVPYASNCKKVCVIYQWTEFHSALRLSYRSLGDLFDLDSLFALQKCTVGQMAGVSFKDLASEAKWLGRSRAGARLGIFMG